MDTYEFIYNKHRRISKVTYHWEINSDITTETCKKHISSLLLGGWGGICYNITEVKKSQWSVTDVLRNFHQLQAKQKEKLVFILVKKAFA